MRAEISLFKNVYAKQPIASLSIQEYFKGIYEGKWQDEVLQYRAGKLEKKKITCVTVSGIFDYRSDDRLTEHSGLIAIDIDHKDQNRSIEGIIGDIKELPELYCLHRSLGGKGLVAYFKISKAKHLDSFEGIEKKLANDYGIIVDPTGKNISRLRFVSWDQVDFYLNEGVTIFKDYIEKKRKINEYEYVNFVYSGHDIDYIIKQITERQLCICPDYYSWLRVGFALASEFGEGGRKYYQIISSYWKGSEKISYDKQYDICLKRDAYKSGGVSIKTLFYLAKQAGCSLVSERTSKIKMISKIRRKQSEETGGEKDWQGSTREFLKTQEGIEGDDVEQIMGQVGNLPDAEMKSMGEEGNIIKEIKTYLKANYQFKMNEITGKVEVDGEDLNDYLFNTIYINVKQIIGNKATKDIIYDIVNSEFTPKFNPILDWFEEHKHLKASGNIKKLAECISSDLSKTDPDFIEYFLEKWLLSIIGSSHDIYSILCLVLTGQEQGTGKTNFFRNLLPRDLQCYFAQNKLDGKDADVSLLMCSKLLILDDEFGGKSKQDEKRFKDLISHETFTVRRPYGRHFEDQKRLAVLCGTTNEEQIVNDMTGNRRIIPIQVNYINEKQYNEIDKDSLFVELYHKYCENNRGWFLSKEDIIRLNDVCFDLNQVTPESELPTKYFRKASKGDNAAKFVTASEIRSTIEKNSGIRLSQQKLSIALKNLNFEYDRQRKDGNQLRGFWVVEIGDVFNTDTSVDLTDDLPF